MAKRQNKISDLFRQSECTDLANKIRKKPGIVRDIELRGSLNGSRIPKNPYRGVVAKLIGRNLQNKGFEMVRRTVDVEFKKAKLNIKPAERDTFADLLNKGSFRRKK